MGTRLNSKEWLQRQRCHSTFHNFIPSLTKVRATKVTMTVSLAPILSRFSIPLFTSMFSPPLSRRFPRLFPRFFLCFFPRLFPASSPLLLSYLILNTLKLIFFLFTILEDESLFDSEDEIEIDGDEEDEDEEAEDETDEEHEAGPWDT
jgi:hypothetical protein